MLYLLDIMVSLQIKIILMIRKNFCFTEAKDSAFLLTSFVFSQFLASIFLTFGIIYSRVFLDFLQNHTKIFWFSLILGSPILLYFRYYKRLKNEEIAKKYEDLSIKRKRLFKIIIPTLIFIIPIFSFLLFRNIVTK
jgi:hypothetical protein